MFPNESSTSLSGAFLVGHACSLEERPSRRSEEAIPAHSTVSELRGVVRSHEVAGSDGGTHPQLLSPDDRGIVLAWTRSRDGREELGLARVELEGPS